MNQISWSRCCVLNALRASPPFTNYNPGSKKHAGTNTGCDSALGPQPPPLDGRAGGRQARGGPGTPLPAGPGLYDRRAKLPACFGDAEADLIAWERETLVVVEVKSRTSIDFGPRPERAFDSENAQHLLRAARQYARRTNVPIESVRFDLVTVVLSDPPELRLFRGVGEVGVWFPLESKAYGCREESTVGDGAPRKTLAPVGTLSFRACLGDGPRITALMAMRGITFLLNNPICATGGATASLASATITSAALRSGFLEWPRPDPERTSLRIEWRTGQPRRRRQGSAITT